MLYCFYSDLVQNDKDHSLAESAWYSILVALTMSSLRDTAVCLVTGLSGFLPSQE